MVLKCLSSWFGLCQPAVEQVNFFYGTSTRARTDKCPKTHASTRKLLEENPRIVCLDTSFVDHVLCNEKLH